MTQRQKQLLWKKNTNKHAYPYWAISAPSLKYSVKAMANVLPMSSPKEIIKPSIFFL